MASTNPPKKLTFGQNLLAGGIAGVTEILIMYPLDVVKTRAQLRVGTGETMLSALVQMVRNEGLGMYRGILPPILVEAPKRAVKFAANNAYQPLFKDEKGVLSGWGAVGAGVMAGCTEALIVVPFELVKIRLQAKENAGKYANTLDCVTKIIRNEGPLTLFNGMESTLWRHATWNGGYFGLIPHVKAAMPQSTSESGKTFTNFVAGALAGTFGTILNTPADVVKSRIQNQPKDKPAKYRWTIPSLKLIAQEEGLRALYKGFVPKVLRLGKGFLKGIFVGELTVLILGPGGGILLVVYEFVSGILQKM